MAGEANYGGNGSVYWKTIHRSGAAPASFKRLGPPGCQDVPVDPVNDHWVDIGNRQRVEGHDPDPVVGPDGDGSFKVKLHFNTSPVGNAAAAAATTGSGQSEALVAARRLLIETELGKLITSAGQALAKIQTGEPDADVIIKVPAMNRPQKPQSQWEITIEW